MCGVAKTAEKLLRFDVQHFEQVIAIRSGKDAPIDPQHDRIVICSYDLIKHEKFRLDYKVVICDESHYLKNMTSQRALKVNEIFAATKLIINYLSFFCCESKILPLLQRARRAVLLSGTPALNKPTELYSQLSAIVRMLSPTALLMRLTLLISFVLDTQFCYSKRVCDAIRRNTH